MILPKHVAIIPDGNRRWAKEKNLPTFQGHRKGAEAADKIIRKARAMGITILSIWGFSTENWMRAKNETTSLMKLFEIKIDKYLAEALQQKVRIIHIGRKDRFSESLKNKIQNAEDQTKHFTQSFLVSALDYGGRDEIIRTIQKIQNAKIKIQNENDINQFLDTKDLPYPNPDLVIRTSGEKRLSGFMIWQAAYAEYIFVDKYFPDFTPVDFEKSINEYVKRQRRFGA
jgi:undecaprenyl diphosphate synthase